jgi:hypothetical protein
MILSPQPMGNFPVYPLAIIWRAPDKVHPMARKKRNTKYRICHIHSVLWGIALICWEKIPHP